jgi:hypothetical protein
MQRQPLVELFDNIYYNCTVYIDVLEGSNGVGWRQQILECCTEAQLGTENSLLNVFSYILESDPQKTCHCWYCWWYCLATTVYIAVARHWLVPSPWLASALFTATRLLPSNRCLSGRCLATAKHVWVVPTPQCPNTNLTCGYTYPTTSNSLAFFEATLALWSMKCGCHCLHSTI